MYKMESDYDKCLADNKRLGDKNKHLLAKTRRLQRVMTNLSNDNECFIADNIAKDICFFVLSSEKQVDKESSAAGTDNCPPMLVESDYESWKIRIERYIRGKPLGKLIWISIQNGPTPHPQITVTEGQGDVAVQVPRDKQDEEFTEIENNKE
ncbi:hypothetical protein Tco_0433173 [Tanacetum coccineum]